MSIKRLFRRKLEKQGLAKRKGRHSIYYRGHKPAGWVDLRKSKNW